MFVENPQKSNIKKLETILENQNFDFLNNSPAKKEIVNKGKESEDVIDPSNPNRQGLENIVQEPGNQNNEILSQQLDVANQQNELLKQNNEILQNQLNQLQQQVSQIVANQVESSTGQPVSPEQAQEASKGVQKEAIQEMKKPGFLQSVSKFFTADLGKSIKNAPLPAKALLALGATGLLAVAVSGWPIFGVTVLGGGLANIGITNVVAATAIKMGLGVTGGLIAINTLRPADKKEQPQPTIDTPAPQPQQAIAEQQVQQPQFQEISEGNMEMAKGIVSGLREIEGDSISYKALGGTIDVGLKYSNNQFTFQRSDQPNNISIVPENDLANGLAGLDNDTLESLQNQIDDIKVRNEQAQQQPIAGEQLNSPENQEKAPESLDLKTLKTGDEIKISAKDQFGKSKDLILVVNDDKTVNAFIENPDGSRQQVAENSFVQSITTAENGRVTPSDEVISTDENTVVNIGRDYKLNQITKLEVVKPTTPEAETPVSTSSPEATKSPETISQSAYAEIGENLNKINETAKLSESDLLNNLHGGIYKNSEPFTLVEKDGNQKELNLSDYLTATAKPSLENLLGVESSFGQPAEFTPQELINMSLAIENTPEIKDSLKQIKTNIPDKITDYRGNSVAHEVMQVVGENLEIAKQTIRANKAIEQVKTENTDRAAGLNAILKLGKDNPIIQAQIAKDFEDTKAKVSLEEFSKQLDEALVAVENKQQIPDNNIFKDQKNQNIAIEMGEKYYTPPNN